MFCKGRVGWLLGLAAIGPVVPARADNGERPARPLRLTTGFSRFWKPSFGGGGGAYVGVSPPLTTGVLPGPSLEDDTHSWLVSGISYDVRRYHPNRWWPRLGATFPAGIVMSGYWETAVASSGAGYGYDPRYSGAGLVLRGEARLVYLGIGTGIYRGGHLGGRVFAGLPTRGSFFLELTYTGFVARKGQHVPRTDPAVMLGVRF